MIGPTLRRLAEYRVAAVASEQATQNLDEINGRLRELNLAVDKTEGELQLAEEKLNLQEQRLFAGGMSAKETENMRLEVESLRRQKSTMEDELLELLDLRETAEGESAEAIRYSRSEHHRSEGTGSEHC